MANSIERMLEINTMIEKGTAQAQNNAPHRVSNQQELDRLIESYDQQVYGPSAEPVLKQEKRKTYDARAEMEHLKEIEANGGRGTVNLEGRHIPRNIVESILNNPLDLPPTTDTRMDELEAKIANKGIKASVDILNKVEKNSREAKLKVNEQLTPRQNTNVGIDLETLKSLIEETFDKKLNDLKQTLNESVTNKQSYVPSMKYLSFKDNFYFVDNDDNVFECVMKYKGKRKK